jgi:hypothetical protein
LSFFCDPFQFNPHSSSCNFHFSCFSLTLSVAICVPAEIRFLQHSGIRVYGVQGLHVQWPTSLHISESFSCPPIRVLNLQRRLMLLESQLTGSHGRTAGFGDNIF